MLALLSSFAVAVTAEIYFKETFDESWSDRWVVPTWKSESAGKFEVGAGPYAEGAGLKTTKDAKFYALATKFEKSFTNEDKDLIIQFQLAFPQSIDCGGGYVKIFGDDVEAIDYSGDSVYNIMFGPDICGSTKKVHAIFRNQDSGDNLDQIKAKEVTALNDKLSHIYTFVIKSDNTYEIHVDGDKKQSGSLKEDWKFLEPKEIEDPELSKPEDWVDEAQIDDPEDIKPEGYDEIAKTIVDPEAEKPEDWDEEDDGEWEAPMIDNPEYKGPWKAERIANPDYKGPWVHPKIANPDFVDNDALYKYPAFGGIGIDIWQVKSGTTYRNIIITDSLDEAKAFASETFGADARKAEEDALQKEKDEEAAKAKAEREAAEAAEEDEEEEEEEEEEDHIHAEL